MHKFASFNFKLFTPEQINLHAVSSATLYGRGIFTTLAVYHEKPFLWEKHWRRIEENAKKTGVNLSEISENSVKDSVFELISANKIENARVRITFYDESASKLWDFETKRKTSVLITSNDLVKTEKNLHLTVSPFRVNSQSPLVNVKSCNYLENILALDEAKSRNFDEAVRLNERNEIVSAVMANLFWIKDEKIYTSALETGCLAGTMREFLLENETIEEKIIGIEKLLKADEIFLTSSGFFIKSVEKIDGKSLKTTISQKLFANLSQKTGKI